MAAPVSKWSVFIALAMLPAACSALRAAPQDPRWFVGVTAGPAGEITYFDAWTVDTPDERRFPSAIFRSLEIRRCLARGLEVTGGVGHVRYESAMPGVLSFAGNAAQAPQFSGGVLAAAYTPISLGLRESLSSQRGIPVTVFVEESPSLYVAHWTYEDPDLHTGTLTTLLPGLRPAAGVELAVLSRVRLSASWTDLTSTGIGPVHWFYGRGEQYQALQQSLAYSVGLSIGI